MKSILTTILLFIYVSGYTQVTQKEFDSRPPNDCWGLPEQEPKGQLVKREYISYDSLGNRTIQVYYIQDTTKTNKKPNAKKNKKIH